MKLSRLFAASALVALAVFSASARADEVAVAVAANFTAPMQKLAPEFERATGHKILASYGSTGQLYAQIKNGAPFEVLLAADDQTPTKLGKEGAVAQSQLTYAIGRLVLWSKRAGMVDDQGAVLKRSDFKHLALANPKLAPYGAAAEQTLKALALFDVLQSKFVTAENISQSYQFIASGNAEMGFVALSQVLTGALRQAQGERGGGIDGSVWIVPAKLYAPIRQDAIILEKGRGKAAAAALMQFLRSEQARNIIRSFGYEF